MLLFAAFEGAACVVLLFCRGSPMGVLSYLNCLSLMLYNVQLFMVPHQCSAAKRGVQSKTLLSLSLAYFLWEIYEVVSIGHSCIRLCSSSVRFLLVINNFTWLWRRGNVKNTSGEKNTIPNLIYKRKSLTNYHIGCVCAEHRLCSFQLAAHAHREISPTSDH